MELCPDGNLAKHKKGIKHDHEKNKIVLGTAKGIQAMHRHNMRHGDLKLENVLISFVMFATFRDWQKSLI